MAAVKEKNSVKNFREAYKKFAKQFEVSEELDGLVDVTIKSVEQIDLLKKIKFNPMKRYTLIQMISNTERLIKRMADGFEKEFGIKTITNDKAEQIAEMERARKLLNLDDDGGSDKLLDMYNREMKKATANPLVVKEIRIEKIQGLIDKWRLDEIADKLNEKLAEA